jgi:hypothetical protein
MAMVQPLDTRLFVVDAVRVHLAVDRHRKLLDPPRQLPRLRRHVLHCTHVDQINSSPVVIR